MIKKISLWHGIFVFFLALITFPVFAATYNLTLETTTEGSLPETEFNRSDVILLHIDLDNSDNPENVAGCAFTLEYPAAVLNPPELSNEGLPTTGSDVQSFFPFMYGSEKTHRIGNRTGELLFSGAAINGVEGTPGAGGAIDHAVDQNLFTVKFTVKSDAPPGGPYTFRLKPTTLDGVGGWTGQASPVLIGAEPKLTSSGTPNPAYNNLDCNANPDCAFPALLSNFSLNPTSQISIVPDGEGCAAYSNTSPDANCDGQNLLGDVMFALRVYNQEETANECNMCVMDTNNDTVIQLGELFVIVNDYLAQ